MVPQVMSYRKSHRRWVVLPKPFKTSRNEREFDNSEDIFGLDRELSVLYEQVPSGRRWFQFGKDAVLRSSIDIISRSGESCGFLQHSTINQPKPKDTGDQFHWTGTNPHVPPINILDLQESAKNTGLALDYPQMLEGWRLGNMQHSYTNKEYICEFGDSKSSAIFCPLHSERTRLPEPSISEHTRSTDFVTSMLNSKCFNAEWLRAYLRHMSNGTGM